MDGRQFLFGVVPFKQIEADHRLQNGLDEKCNFLFLVITNIITVNSKENRNNFRRIVLLWIEIDF